MRTQQEILDRINDIADADKDPFGFRRAALYLSLDYENATALNVVVNATARNIVASGIDEQAWGEHILDTDEKVEAVMLDDLKVGFERAARHRGISAINTLARLREDAWLLGRSDVRRAMRAVPYAQYGVPVLVAFAEAYGESTQEVWAKVKTLELERMATGLPCDTNCAEGCAA